MSPTNRMLVATLLVALLAFPVAAQARCANSAKSASNLSVDQAQRALRCVLNKQRKPRGLRKLKQRDTLEAAAQYHAEDMSARGYFGHTSPSGEGPKSRAVAFGYLRGDKGSVGEVLALGTNWSAADAVRGWLGSGGHRDAILTRRFRHLGVGVAQGSTGTLFSVSLGRR